MYVSVCPSIQIDIYKYIPRNCYMNISYLCLMFWLVSEKWTLDSPTVMWLCQFLLFDAFLPDFVVYVLQRYSLRCVNFFHCYIFLVDFSFYEYEVLLFLLYIFTVAATLNDIIIVLFACFSLVSICLVHITNFPSFQWTSYMHLEWIIAVFILPECLCQLIDKFNSLNFVVITKK